MKKSVLIIQRRMTEYRVPMFESLKRRLEEDGITLKVIHGQPTREEEKRGDEGELPWAIRISCRYFQIGSISLTYQNIPRAFLSGYDLIVIPHENSHIFNYWLLLLSALKHTRVAFWGHGANFNTETRDTLRERFKKWNAPLVDWWFAYTSLSKAEVMKSGFPEDRITCLDNAIDVNRLFELRNSITPDEQEFLRKKLGLGHNTGVYLGSLTQEKRLDFLFSAADAIHAGLHDFNLVIIGDGPLRERVQDFVREKPWVCWVGARHGREKALYASLGTVMLNPGMVGLNILDSFAMGLPVVTTDCGIHSPEIAYLKPSKNGFMTNNSIASFSNRVASLLDDKHALNEMSARCRRDASQYTLENMAENFSQGIKGALGDNNVSEAPVHIAVVWQRFLPYHIARIKHLQKKAADLGYRLTAIEVSAYDSSYWFDEDFAKDRIERICAFPGIFYQELKTHKIYDRVFKILKSCSPDIVFAPATAFPEGMAALTYRQSSGKRAVMMDDAWEHTDRRGIITKFIKRLIHRNIDGAFIPADSHLSYYTNLGFPENRIYFGVDAVDNEYFSAMADLARKDSEAIKAKKGLSDNYFLFVGRFLPRKGLETLIKAYQNYRAHSYGSPWELILVGNGPYEEDVKRLAADTPGIYFAGPQIGDDLCYFYGLAGALIVPSSSDPWALVVNEAMASGLPVLVSSGCGSSLVLVREGENGWTFTPGDSGRLAELMLRISTLPPDKLYSMGKRSQAIIADWSLDRFSDGVLQAMALPRREEAGLVSRLATKLWKGRMSIT